MTWIRYRDIKGEDDLGEINDLVQGKLDSIQSHELTKKYTHMNAELVTPDMVEWYRIWKRAGRLSWDARPQLNDFFKQLTGSPIRDTSCDGCIREAWEKLEAEVIRFINKPL